MFWKNSSKKRQIYFVQSMSVKSVGSSKVITFKDNIHLFSCIFAFFFFYFIFKLYIIVLVLPNIKMNLPQVYMCSPS